MVFGSLFAMHVTLHAFDRIWNQIQIIFFPFLGDIMYYFYFQFPRYILLRELNTNKHFI